MQQKRELAESKRRIKHNKETRHTTRSKQKITAEIDSLYFSRNLRRVPNECK